MRRRLERAIRALVLGMGLALAGFSQADNSAAEIKTAFIYNFAKFVEWPATAFGANSNTLVLCSWGAVLDGKLQLLNGREAQGRRIRVRSLDSPEDWQGCHIAVVGEVGDALRNQLLQNLNHASVLTISDTSDFLQNGGMISLFVEANRVQFSVNLNAAQSSGLKMSARMLQLARTVRGGTP